jgi:hypothetical protein
VTPRRPANSMARRRNPAKPRLLPAVRRPVSNRASPRLRERRIRAAATGTVYREAPRRSRSPARAAGGSRQRERQRQRATRRGAAGTAEGGDPAGSSAGGSRQRERQRQRATRRSAAGSRCRSRQRQRERRWQRQRQRAEQGEVTARGTSRRARGLLPPAAAFAWLAGNATSDTSGRECNEGVGRRDCCAGRGTHSVV